MGCILLGIFIVVLSFFIGLKIDERYGIFSEIVVYAGLILFFLSIGMGVVFPVSGYEEPIIVSSIYAEIDSDFANYSDKAYKNTLAPELFTIVESDRYTEPCLVTYARHPKKTFWTFARTKKIYEQVLYVPVGSMNVKLS